MNINFLTNRLGRIIKNSNYNLLKFVKKILRQIIKKL